ncbi:glycosyltransferase 87 family protein [Arthrobacter sp. L77]|uniref:glycosyltransferase 87 family protein n=1 Tax=Arthrobacter sp. L77 TaxID=1496689 RepID=UPI00068FF062|nr:glycosyltransferase 87 family protein [Arthrobacter sp. L77]
MRIRLPRPETRNSARSVWLFFALVHAGFLARLLPFVIGGGVLSDVRFYREWAYQALGDGVWQGIDTAWVYPAGALAPMLVAAAFGPYLYQLAWFVLFAGLNAVGVAALIRRGTPSSSTAAYWWLTVTALLGPVAVGRIDGLTAPLVITALLIVAARPFVASLLLSAATWMKVWPAAVVLAALVVVREGRLRILAAGAALTAGIAVVVAVFGDVRNLTGFLSAQGARGMQLEAPLSTPGVWQAITGTSGAYFFEDEVINTMEVRGALSGLVGDLMSPLLALTVLLVAVFLGIALHRGAEPGALLATGSLALVSTLVVFNKVGSPQFMLWIAATIAAGLVLDRAAEWRYPAVAMLATAALTTLVYPVFYDALRYDLNPAVAVLLTLRNLLVVSIFVWSLVRLGRLTARARSAAEAAAPRSA